MKRFQEFTENVDKVAALKAKQRAAVDKFKSGNEPAPKQTPERRLIRVSLFTSILNIIIELTSEKTYVE